MSDPKVTSLEVTLNPVKVDTFVAPQPNFDWRELRVPGTGSDMADRIRVLEKQVRLQAEMLAFHQEILDAMHLHLVELSGRLK